MEQRKLEFCASLDSDISGCVSADACQWQCHDQCECEGNGDEFECSMIEADLNGHSECVSDLNNCSWTCEDTHSFAPTLAPSLEPCCVGIKTRFDEYCWQYASDIDECQRRDYRCQWTC